MALFNKRQVGYIKAVAGVGKHKTYIHKRIDTTLASSGYVLTSTSSRVDASSKNGIVYTVALVSPHTAVDASDTSDNPTSWVPSPTNISAACKKGGYMDQMRMLDAAVVTPGSEANFTATDKRVGPEFYLDSTHLRMRFTMPDFQVISGKQPHYEYRLIVFRPRKTVTTTDSIGVNTAADPLTALHGALYLNFHYDLFNGYVARPIGLQGYRAKQELDGGEYYSGNVQYGSTYAVNTGDRSATNPTGEPALLTMDDFMTLPVNDADYIVKTDERFFLGPEHGKSHFEKNMKINWTERGETDHDDMGQGLPEGFIPNWYIMLLATSNDTASPNLNVLYRATTYAESS